MKSVPKKSRKIKKEKKKIPFLSIFFISIFLILTSLYIYRLVTFQTKEVNDSPKTETKKIPAEVKKNLNPDETSYKVPILMYHYVEYVTDQKDTFRKSMNIEPPIFEAQIKTLKDSGYTFMTAAELANIINGYRMLPDKPVVITFDDGHWDNASVVLPILKKYNAKATFYLISDFLNGSDFLTDVQVREIIESGLVEIGSHTKTHIGLAGKLSPIVGHEVFQSKEDLEKRFGIRVVSFAYPNGEFDNQAIEIVKKAGYTNAVSTIPGTNQSGQNKYFLFRLRPAYRTGEDLIKFFDQTEFSPYNDPTL